ncbi:MAG: TAXI family TRAP transporter solute-binding subunit [Thermodesulfobacteriota bacterium]
MKRKRFVMSMVIVAVLFSSTVCLAAEANYLFATGGVSGTYYPLGGIIAQIWNKKIPNLNVTIQATGASVENIRLLGSKSAEVALSLNDVNYYGYNGLEVFKAKSEKYTNFSAIGNVYPDVIQIISRKDGPIRTIADLKGRKVAVGAPGSGAQVSARQILGLYGMDYLTRKDLNPVYVSPSESADQFKDNHLDACYFSQSIPNAAIQDVNVTNPIQLLEIDEAMCAKIIKAHPFFICFVIPENTYRGQEKPVKTVAVWSSLLVRNDLPENIVYQMTKVMYEESAAIAQAHSAGKYLKLEAATAGIPVPFHPGAIKYFKEKGIIK